MIQRQVVCPRTWEELSQFATDQASCDLCGARYVTAVHDAEAIGEAAIRRAPIAVPRELLEAAEAAYAGSTSLVHLIGTPTAWVNAIRAALMAAIQAELGPREPYGSHTLFLGPVESTGTGFRVSFGFLDDRDSFSMYDKSTLWRGTAEFADRDGTATLERAEMIVVDAGHYHYHPLGEVRRLNS